MNSFYLNFIHSLIIYKWPPPPRTTPIIVPVHLRDTGSTSIDAAPIDLPAAKSKPTKAKNKKTKSSLHRAVMERLEVQKAMSEPGYLT